MEGKENQAYQPDVELHNFQGDVSNEPKSTIDQSEEEPYQHIHQRKIDKEKQPNNNESFTIQEDVPSSITKKVTRKGDIFSRAVGAFWASLGRFYKRHKQLLERLTLVLLNVCVLVYFAVAISHHVKQGNEDIGWCNGLGILIILLFFLYMWMFYYLIVKRYFGRILYEHIVAPSVRVWDKAWERTLFRVAISLLVLAALVVFLVLDTVGSRERLVSFFGLIVILLFGFIFSRHPTQILWRPVLWGLGIQFIFGVLTIRWVVGRQIFQCIGDHVSTFLLYTNSGSTFAYGEFLVTNQGVFAFQVMPVIFFFCFCVQILFYYGIIQNIVVKLGWLLQISLGTTVAESVNASASVFLGMSEAPLLIQGYLKDLTKSEVHAIMAGGFATVAGTVLAAYISFGAQADHLITASIMSAPAALCFSKLFYPETEDSKNTVDQIVIIKDESTGVLDAAVKGVTAGIQIVLGIIANVIAFIAFVAFLNGILTWIGDMVGVPDVTFVNIMGYIFIPLAWVMGVEWEQCEDVAKLVGLKTMVNEFVAYQELGVLKKAGKLSPRSEAIATYALCGFSNPGSLGILIGSLTSLCPSQRPIITEVAFRAFIAGSAVCFMTACIAGILLTEDQYTNNETNTTISP